jgi:EAL domain-containing protein (putative c-di-GMP-specific phosphodiesterase class I)
MPWHFFNHSGIAITLQADGIDDLLQVMTRELSSVELHGTKVLTTAGDQPTALELGRVLTGSAFVHRYQGRWIIDSLESENYQSWFQPIVDGQALQAPLYAHEALFRMFDNHGALIPPDTVFALAGDSELLFNLDLAARRCAVESASKAKLPGKLFINFNPSSIYDPAYCLRETAAAINALGLKPADIVFEITETHRARDEAHLTGILSFYRSAGFGVALDDIGSGYASLNLLQKLRPDYAKIDMDLIRDIDKDGFKQTIVSHLIDIARTSGILTVGEGVETAAEAAWLRNAGISFMQSFYFGRPRYHGEALAQKAAPTETRRAACYN